MEGNIVIQANNLTAIHGFLDKEIYMYCHPNVRYHTKSKTILNDIDINLTVIIYYHYTTGPVDTHVSNINTRTIVKP